jgi:hypothetical protein
LPSFCNSASAEALGLTIIWRSFLQRRTRPIHIHFRTAGRELKKKSMRRTESDIKKSAFHFRAKSLCCLRLCNNLLQIDEWLARRQSGKRKWWKTSIGLAVAGIMIFLTFTTLWIFLNMAWSVKYELYGHNKFDTRNMFVGITLKKMD